MSETILKISNLGKCYNGKLSDKSSYALKDVDIEFSSGEFVVIIGPSGAGKSTFLRCLNRMIDPTCGSMCFQGNNVEKARGKKLRHIRSNIGMVFQNYNLIGRTNVIKNVLNGRLGKTPIWKSIFGFFTYEEKREALELLTQIGLKDQIYKRADELSGGQMQRVGICRALIQHPSLLLADEPIASLDPKSADIVMDKLYEMTKERGLTCIVNLHQVDYAKKYATRIVGIKDGKVVFDDVPEKLTDKITADIYSGKEQQMYLQGTKPKTERNLYENNLVNLLQEEA